jgi:hypothetical protein
MKYSEFPSVDDCLYNYHEEDFTFADLVLIMELIPFFV